MDGWMDGTVYKENQFSKKWIGKTKCILVIVVNYLDSLHSVTVNCICHEHLVSTTTLSIRRYTTYSHILAGPRLEQQQYTAVGRSAPHASRPAAAVHSASAFKPTSNST